VCVCVCVCSFELFHGRLLNSESTSSLLMSAFLPLCQDPNSNDDGSYEVLITDRLRACLISLRATEAVLTSSLGDVRLHS